MTISKDKFHAPKFAFSVSTVKKIKESDRFVNLTVTIPIDTTPHHPAWQCTAKDIETAFITGGEANLTISGNYLWLRTHKLIPHENFSVLSPVFKHFQLFGSVLPSGMVTVKMVFLSKNDAYSFPDFCIFFFKIRESGLSQFENPLWTPLVYS